jgi:hypothetical protein
MPFGLTNLHVFFQHLLNDVFREYLDNFMVYYIDDIFIFSNNIEDHERHIHIVLEKLRKVRLYTKLEKCEFHQSKVKFLGYVISKNDIRMDPRKVQTIFYYATPTFVQDVQFFLDMPTFINVSLSIILQ